MTTSYLQQSSFNIVFDWGQRAVEVLSPICDVVVIVDVLSFSTTVAFGTARGAIIFPFQYKDESALRFAEERLAVLAGARHPSALSLSPQSMFNVEAGTRIVLPSPNGATLSLLSRAPTTFAGSLVNAYAVAQASKCNGQRIAVIAAGERWSDGSLRPGIEDLIGAGAIISNLEGRKSPEALTAEGAFHSCRSQLEKTLIECVSGQELAEKGFRDDVRYAARLDHFTDVIPRLCNSAYENFSSKSPERNTPV